METKNHIGEKMKNRKWLTYTLRTLLALVVLAAVAIVSYRIGMTQNPSLTHPTFARGFFSGAPRVNQRNFQNNGGPQGMQGNFNGNRQRQMRGNPQNHGFANHGGRMSFLFPFIFGVIHLVVLGLILWVVYLLVKKSGWRLTRVQETFPAPTQTANVEEVEKKKTSK
jgi:hypothetical protein